MRETTHLSTLIIFIRICNKASKKTFQQANYVENFIQSFFNALNDDIDRELPGKQVSIMVGGDGRFFGLECCSRILKLSAANPRINKVIFAQNGIMSTPAVSACIRKYKTFAGIILTASHNPGGPENDFGIKFNCSNGGPALAALTDKVYTISTQITEYNICENIECDIAKLGEHSYQVDDRTFEVKVIDSVQDYLELMKDIFNFEALRNYIKSGAVRITVNSLNGVMGPYVKRILCEELGMQESEAYNCTPL